MSTRLTKKGVPMVESHTLQLVLSTAQINQSISGYLSKSLKAAGYEFATPSALTFLSALECGVNFGAEIARNLGVSRQMVAKTVKGLCLAGYLEQVDDVGKQKKILFTKTGELLMSDARQLLANIDEILGKQMGESEISKTLENLNKLQEAMDSLNNS